MMTVNVHQGLHQVTLAGTDYQLKLSLGAMAEIETALSLETMADFQAIFAKPNVTVMIVVVAAMLAAGEGMPFKDARNLVSDLPVEELQAVINGINDGFAAAMPKESKDPNPPGAAAP